MIFNLIIVIIGGYLIGSIPYGLVLVKLFKGIDLREVGSKNIGATNALRVGGFALGLATLILDTFKGAFAIILCRIFINTPSLDLSLLAGFCALSGHLFPIWLKFKGGKGVATSLGTILATNPVVGLLCLITWLITAIISKYSSLSAIITFIMLPIYFYILDASKIYYGIIISIIIIYKHKENIIRLLNKSESKIKLKKSGKA
jgi:glycerol-3-phosphate acyltransferase PlsY